MLGTAEWDSPIATNQHYVARELARIAEITFVESLGLRRPTLRRDDLIRMASRLRRATRGERPAGARRPRPDRTHVVSPLVVPVHRAPTRPVNRALLRRATAGWHSGPGPRVLWTFTPVTYGLEEFADVVVYHCVDLLAAFPGVDSVAVTRGERRLASRTDLAIATSQAVETHLHGAGFPRLILLPNVADVTVFAEASLPAAKRRPSVLFSGNLTSHKLHVEALCQVAQALRGSGELLLAGPLAAGGGQFDHELRRLEEHGARYLGLLTPQQLAEVAGECTVGLIPYALNDYTRGVSPLKCFEYLASGLRVVSTPLPSVVTVAETNPHVDVVEPELLAQRVTRLVAPGDDESIAARLALAAEHGWEPRGRMLRTLLTREVAESRGQRLE